MKKKSIVYPKITRTAIKAATGETDERLNNAISEAEDDFDYIIQGLEHLGRQGANATSEALKLVEDLEKGLKNILGRIANNVSEE